MFGPGLGATVRSDGKGSRPLWQWRQFVMTAMLVEVLVVAVVVVAVIMVLARWRPPARPPAYTRVRTYCG